MKMDIKNEGYNWIPAKEDFALKVHVISGNTHYFGSSKMKSFLMSL